MRPLPSGRVQGTYPAPQIRQTSFGRECNYILGQVHRSRLRRQLFWNHYPLRQVIPNKQIGVEVVVPRWLESARGSKMKALILGSLVLALGVAGTVSSQAQTVNKNEISSAADKPERLHAGGYEGLWQGVVRTPSRFASRGFGCSPLYDGRCTSRQCRHFRAVAVQRPRGYVQRSGQSRPHHYAHGGNRVRGNPESRYD